MSNDAAEPLAAKERKALSKALSAADQTVLRSLKKNERRSVLADRLGLTVPDLRLVRQAAAGQPTARRILQHVRRITASDRAKPSGETLSPSASWTETPTPQVVPTSSADRKLGLSVAELRVVNRWLSTVNMSLPYSATDNDRLTARARAGGVGPEDLLTFERALSGGPVTASTLGTARALLAAAYRNTTGRSKQPAPSSGGATLAFRIRCLHGRNLDGCTRCQEARRSGEIVYVTTSSAAGAYHATPDCGLLYRGQSAALTMDKEIYPIEMSRLGRVDFDGYHPCTGCYRT